MILYESAGLLIYCIVCAAILGAAFGSFLNCAAWRIARGESFVRGRSRCPACGHILGASELIPVLSWLMLRGRCASCREKIPARYPLTELAFAALTVACLLRFGLTVLCLRNWIFLCCLFCLSLTDLDSRMIPDGCLAIAALAWLGTLPFLWNGWRDTLLHLATGLVFSAALLGASLVLDRVLKKESLGGGDIKLFAVAGLYLGFVQSLFGLMLACILGLAAAKWIGRGRDGYIPFGPAISAACAVMLFFGGKLTGWYLALL